ncbi:MAG TPA: amidohydrolase family protein [Thermoanaerobaculaceae bacterium]|nr:amidohydrolase family protein [Thermoanaerobaculaceae bacterium]
MRGGTVWGEDGGRRADVRVVGGRITEIGELSPRPGECVIDASGLDVLPGMIDVHVHVADRIGRFELADDWASAAEVALRNGVTTLAGFATQRPGETLTQAVERCLARAAGESRCDFAFHLTPTAWPWDWDELAALAARGFRTVKLYTTYREAGLYSDAERLAAVMPRLAALGMRLLLHCEDDAALAAIDPASVDLADPRSHARLRPAAAEVRAIETAIGLAERSGCPTHVVHVSTATGVEAIAAARGRGVPITCETAPHYLALDEEALRPPEGHRYLCTPPLRAAATRDRLAALAAAGGIDLFATDHCAFTRRDKDDWHGDLRAVPSGIAGLGALVPVMYELLATRGERAPAELALRLAANPARLLGAFPRKGAIAVGSDADLVILERAGPPRPIVSTLADAYETYPGRTTTLAVRRVIRRGRIVVEDGVTLASPPAGALAVA